MSIPLHTLIELTPMPGKQGVRINSRGAGDQGTQPGHRLTETWLWTQVWAIGELRHIVMDRVHGSYGGKGMWQVQPFVQPRITARCALLPTTPVPTQMAPWALSISLSILTAPTRPPSLAAHTCRVSCRTARATRGRWPGPASARPHLERAEPAGITGLMQSRRMLRLGAPPKLVVLLKHLN